MLSVALASVRGNLVRFLLTALAVALGAAFVSGTFATRVSLNETFTSMVSDTSQGIDVYVRGKTEASGFAVDAEQPATDLDFAETLRGVDGVKTANPDLMGNALLVGKDGTATRRGGAPTFGVAYYEDDSTGEIVEGRLPKNGEEIAVESATLELSGWKVGDTAKLIVNSDQVDVTIVGDIKVGSMAGAAVVLLDGDSAAKYFAPDGKARAFAVGGDGSISQKELADRVSRVLPADFEALTGEDYIEETKSGITSQLGFITIFLLIFAVISVIVGAFIIVNTFLMLLGQRTKELAMLRAIGTRKRQIMTMVMVEATVIGIIGAVIGYFMGVGLANGLNGFMKVAFDMQTSPVPWYNTSGVIAALAVGIGVTVLAAAVPAFQASRTAPVAAMTAGATSDSQPLNARTTVAVFVLVAGVVVMIFGLVADENKAWLLGGASALLFAGMVIGMARLVRPFIEPLAWPLAKVSSIASMASENTTRNPRRTALTAAALMVGLALVSGVGVLASSTEVSTKSIVQQNVKADFILTTGNGPQSMSSDILDKMENVKGVGSVAGLTLFPLTIGDDETRATATNLKDFLASIEYTVNSGSVDNLSDTDILVSSKVAKDDNYVAGEQYTFTVGRSGPKKYTVAAILEESPLVRGLTFADSQVKDAVPADAKLLQTVFLRTNGDADNAAVRGDVTDIVKPLIIVGVMDKDEYAESATGDMQQILGFIYGLLALSIVIAALGVANTLAMSIFERTREIGMLRAIGLKKGQLWRMVVLESVWTALFGALLGVALGLVLGLLMQQWLASSGLEELGIPWHTIGVVLVVAAIVGVLAALVPAFRATRIRILDAIAQS